jgi:hypothetical protein
LARWERYRSRALADHLAVDEPDIIASLAAVVALSVRFERGTDAGLEVVVGRAAWSLCSSGVTLGTSGEGPVGLAGPNRLFQRLLGLVLSKRRNHHLRPAGKE